MKLQSSEELARIIIDRRKEAGYTQVQAAKACGVSISFMNKLENAKPTIQVGKVFKVLSMLGVDLVAIPRPIVVSEKVYEKLPLEIEIQ